MLRNLFHDYISRSLLLYYSVSEVLSVSSMVVSSQHLASAVGAQILQEGGNAIDAAVAVGYALAVTYP
ncbi:MAG TPA: hypothetical protein ACFCUY_05885, partial [Xenococcaceae cyanobacterium]